MFEMNKIDTNKKEKHPEKKTYENTVKCMDNYGIFQTHRSNCMETGTALRSVACYQTSIGNSIVTEQFSS